MSDRRDHRDRSAERRSSRVQSSRSTNARERSRSPTRTADRSARDRGYEPSSASNPYSRREYENTRRYDSGREEWRDNTYSKRGGETDDSRSSFRKPSPETRPSSHGGDHHDSSGSHQRDSTHEGQTRTGTNDHPLGSRGGRSDAPTGHQGDYEQSDRNRSSRGGGSWGGFSRTDAPQGGHDSFSGGDRRGGGGGGGARNYHNDDNRGSGYGGGGYGRGGGDRGRGRGGGGRGGGGRGGGGRGGYGAAVIIEGPPLPEFVPVPLNGKDLQLPTPPRQGRTGQPIKVFTNHFEVQSLPRIELYQYDIRVTAEVRRAGGPLEDSEVKQCAPTMVNKVMENPNVKEILGEGFIFDGVSIGWSTQKLPFPTDPFRHHLELPGSRPGRTFGCNIDIRQSGRFSTEPLVQWLRNESQRVVSLTDRAILSTQDHIQLCLKFLNALLRSDPSKRFVTGQGNKSTTYFDRTPSTTLTLKSTGNVLEAWRGFYQTAIVRFGKLTVNVDTTTNAFIRPGINFLDAIGGFAGLTADQVESAFLQNRDDLKPIMKKLVGIGFKVRHLKSGPKSDMVRRVMKLTARGASEETFERRKFHQDPVTGEDTVSMEIVSVEKYYSQQYNINIRFLRLPMVESRKGEKYPLELCFVSDSERWKEILQGAETADFIKFATGPAFVRKGQIEENLKKLAWHNQGELKEFGVSINPQFMSLEARVLPAPIPLYKRGTDPRAPSEGRWNLRNKTFHTAQRVTGWGLMYFPGGGMRVSEERLREFAENCNRSFSTYGMDVKRHDPAVSTANQQGDLKRSIKEMLVKISQKGITPNLMMFLLSSASAEPYSTIKKICDVDFGIASQCMIVEKAFSPKGQQQYLGNISMKVNIKLGGINAWISDPILVRGPTLVMGCDASYPNASQLRMSPPLPTFTAIAANYDKYCAKYTAVTNSQEPGREDIRNFGKMAQELINRFAKHSGCFPETILYFRDGLSEGGLGSVLKSELSELKAVTKAKVTVVLCVKRHHTRLFPGPGDKGDTLGNVAPGTVVENGNGKDIFLVSHRGLQGTVRPTHYVTLYDENNLTPDQFQGLCNNLCYGYGRATVSVSIVPPIYYARLACERARMHVGPDGSLSQVNSTLVNSMWWQ